MSVRCTETFNKNNAQYFFLGYPLWSKPSNDPKIALEVRTQNNLGVTKIGHFKIYFVPLIQGVSQSMPVKLTSVLKM